MTPIIERRKNQIRWTIGLATYPLDAVYGACYVFLDRCYVFLDRPDRRRILVTLRARAAAGAPALEALAGDFAAELLHQVLRVRIAERTGKLREMIIGRALYSAGAGPDEETVAGPPEPLPGADADYLEDPLGIAIPWEEKYGQDAAPPVPGEAPKTPGGPPDPS
jgi:His-Xaa-Ser system protein HxsD